MILKGLKHMNTVIGRRGGGVLFGTKCQILGERVVVKLHCNNILSEFLTVLK